MLNAKTMTAEQAYREATSNKNKFLENEWNKVMEAVGEAIDQGELRTVYYGELSPATKAKLIEAGYIVDYNYDRDGSMYKIKYDHFRPAPEIAEG